MQQGIFHDVINIHAANTYFLQESSPADLEAQ